MDDVFFGYVYDFGSGEEWVAETGKGALLNGADLGPIFPKEEIEILSFEATLTSSVAEKAASVVGLAYRLRIMGSLALSLCHLAAGTRRRGLLAQGRALGRHRRRAAAGPGARPGDRPARSAAVRRGAARHRRPQPLCRGRHAGGLRAAVRRALGVNGGLERFRDVALRYCTLIEEAPPLDLSDVRRLLAELYVAADALPSHWQTDDFAGRRASRPGTRDVVGLAMKLAEGGDVEYRAVEVDPAQNVDPYLAVVSQDLADIWEDTQDGP